MIGFTSGCVYLPSLVPLKLVNQNNLGDMPDLDGGIVDHCMAMLREKMPFSPFKVKEVRGHLILLRRDAPSYCPICHPSEFSRKLVPTYKDQGHDKEHPFMFIIGGKVYWDCRRCGDEAKKFFIGYLAMTIEELQTGAPILGIQPQEEEDVPETAGEFMFGDFNLGPPTLAPQKKDPVVKQEQNSPTVTPQRSPKLEPLPGDPNPTIFIPPPEQRRQDVQSNTLKIAQAWAQKKYLRREPEDLTGARTLNTVTGQIPWNAGLK